MTIAKVLLTGVLVGAIAACGPKTLLTPGDVDPCKIMSPTELSPLAGMTLAEGDHNATGTSCLYRRSGAKASDSSSSVQVTVLTDDTPQEFRRSLENAKKVGNARSISGIGEEAFLFGPAKSSSKEGQSPQVAGGDARSGSIRARVAVQDRSAVVTDQSSAEKILRLVLERSIEVSSNATLRAPGPSEGKRLDSAL